MRVRSRKHDCQGRSELRSPQRKGASGIISVLIDAHHEWPSGPKYEPRYHECMHVCDVPALPCWCYSHRVLDCYFSFVISFCFRVHLFEYDSLRRYRIAIKADMHADMVSCYPQVEQCFGVRLLEAHQTEIHFLCIIAGYAARKGIQVTDTEARGCTKIRVRLRVG